MATSPNQETSSRSQAGSEREQQPETTLSLLRRLLEELAILFRQEMALARAEISEQLSTAKIGVASVATGSAVLFAGFLVLLSAAVLALAEVMPPWLAALIVGVIVGSVGYFMLNFGRRRLEPSALKPEKTQESLRRAKDVLERKNP